MNPNLTANLRAERELRAEIEKQKQTFTNWQQSPIQGAIPQPASDWQKEFIYDALAVALPNLQAAADTAKHLVAHLDLYTAICDALNACNEALERVTDAPDDTPDALYDVATQGQPIKGKVHPLEPAFDAIDITDDPDFEF